MPEAVAAHAAGDSRELEKRERAVPPQLFHDWNIGSTEE
jgi:hypothetical protein